MVVKIRKLSTADMFTVIGMLKKVVAAGGSNLGKLIVSGVGESTKKDKGKTDEENAIRVGFLVINELYDHLLDDLKAWFASLCCSTPEDYMDMPAETTLDIIEALIDGQESKDFFSKALQLYRKIEKYSDIGAGK